MFYFIYYVNWVQAGVCSQEGLRNYLSSWPSKNVLSFVLIITYTDKGDLKMYVSLLVHILEPSYSVCPVVSSRSMGIVVTEGPRLFSPDEVTSLYRSAVRIQRDLPTKTDTLCTS